MSSENKHLNSWREDAAAIVDYYNEKTALYGGIGPECFGWRDKNTQHRFYREATSLIEMPVASVLDIGCGKADFYDFLVDDIGATFSYTGLDVVSAFVENAQVRHKSLALVNTSFIDFSSTPCSYDLVINMGGLTSRVSSYEDYLLFNIEKMLYLSKRFVVFNLIVNAQDGYFVKSNNVGRITGIGQETLHDLLGDVRKKCGYMYSVTTSSIIEGSSDAFVVLQREAK